MITENRLMYQIAQQRENDLHQRRLNNALRKMSREQQRALEINALEGLRPYRVISAISETVDVGLSHVMETKREDPLPVPNTGFVRNYASAKGEMDVFMSKLRFNGRYEAFVVTSLIDKKIDEIKEKYRDVL